MRSNDSQIGVHLVAYAPHTLLSFGGTLSEPTGPLEIWECGVRCVSRNSGGPVPEGEIEGMLDAIVDGEHGQAQTIKAWFAATSSLMATGAKLTFVKLNNIGANGKYSNPGLTHVRDFTGVAGGGGSASPSFISSCITWETGLSRGPGHRGRIYPPNYTVTYTSALISIADAGLVRDSGVALINLINDTHNDDAGSDELSAVVASGVNASLHQITGVSVDTALDVQRRRKNQVGSTRTTVAPVTA